MKATNDLKIVPKESRISEDPFPSDLRRNTPRSTKTPGMPQVPRQSERDTVITVSPVEAFSSVQGPDGRAQR